MYRVALLLPLALMINTRSQSTDVHIVRLPAELLIRITEFLPLADTKNLSAISNQFRRFLVPTLFRVLKATNRDKDAEELEQIVKSFGRHVKRLKFECHLAPEAPSTEEEQTEVGQGNELGDVGEEGTEGAANEQQDEHVDGHVSDADDDKEDDEIHGDGVEDLTDGEAPDDGDDNNADAEGTTGKPWDLPGFSQIAQDLLSGKHLSSLTAVTLVFCPQEEFNGYYNEGEADWGGPRDIGEGSIYIHERLETEEERLREERDYQWRKDVHMAFERLSENGLICEVDVQRLVPKVCSVWLTEEWRTLMARLKRLSIGLWGGEF